MTSHSPASSPEMPKLPDFTGSLAYLDGFEQGERIREFARTYGRACYEAGSAAAAQAAWRPISEAPKDGSGMLALWVHPGDSVTARNYALVEFVRGCWRDTESDDQVYTEPTYWQPLPTPPAAPTGEQA